MSKKEADIKIEKRSRDGATLPPKKQTGGKGSGKGQGTTKKK